ncbi:MAG: UPF0182 family protein [Deltaproteobacteria bacterium]|nr:UPF0182 family protein [Deltaproteobacteria bacterium]
MSPTVVFNNQEQPKTPMQGGKGMIIFIIVFILMLFSWQIINLVTNWYWFQEVGYQTVFSVSLLAKIKTGLLFGIGFIIIFFGNLYLAGRLSTRTRPLDLGTAIPVTPLEIDQRSLNNLIISSTLVFGFFSAMQGAAHWADLLRFTNSTPFGLADPLLDKDVGFYVFSLPFLLYVYAWTMTVIVISTVAVGLIYFLRRSFIFIPPKTVYFSPAAKTHLLILGAIICFLLIFGYWLDLNELLFAKRGVVFGPGYTEVTTQVWILKFLMGLSALAGIGVLSFIFLKNWRIPVAVLLLLVVVVFLGRGVYPAFVQRFKVIPNEIVLEKPYLERNIKYTRIAYKLHDIEDREFPVEDDLTIEGIRRNDPTVKNIRLWDHAPLLWTYGQLQEIRTYYKFTDVDNDRYNIKGEIRQVMLSPRELSYPSLPARTWVNEHLIYTHGYGAVMGPVNRISPEGLPEFFIQDIPPISSTEIKVTRPEIYYGETSNDYVFVKTKRPEFDYPVGDQNVYSRYEGKGGVPLSFFRKVLFAARFGAFTILLSNDITSESKVMYYRTIKERVSQIAPFIRLDADPYLVVSKEGRLLWILDGYTVTERFPYSEPIPKMGNYIRNALKAVVDAYDGSVDLYISDADDPIMKTYAKIFPGVFKNLDQMPEEIQSHLRYPVGMMSIQAHMYRAYHMEDPQVFYNKEDLWSIPIKSMQGGEGEMEPYYTIMRLPNEKKEEFILLLPFTPRNKDNMSAWMGARCDAPNYGKVIVYKFPKKKLIYGPRQIEARIDQDTEISQQISLWNQSGSQVIRGSLLAIPIERSILYVEPLYLAAERGQLPELKRVIVGYANTIAMEENLELSLQRIFGGALIKSKETGKPVSERAVVEKEKTYRNLAIDALSHYRKAQEALRKGNWSGYGEEMKIVENILQDLEKKNQP